MPDKIERLIKSVYKQWKKDLPKPEKPHPDEETFALFIEGKLSNQESKEIKEHLINCDRCIEILTIQAKIRPGLKHPVPGKLLEQLKDLVEQKQISSILEIILKVKENFLEILNTTGDVLVGQELVPAPIFRSRKQKDFKDEVTILKDFQDIRVQIRIENKGNSIFNLVILIKEKQTHQIIKDLRVSLLRDNLELESYLTDTGRVSFERIPLGKYTIEISSIKEKLASVLLDIKI